MKHVKLQEKQCETLLPLALDLLSNSERYESALPDGGVVRFEYASIIKHDCFIRPLKELAAKYKLNLMHPRLSRYNKGDLIDPHVDTIPDVVWAGVWLLQSEEPRLVIEYDNDVILLPDLTDQILLFDPKLKHAVLPIKGELSRIVVNFWLCSQELHLK